MSLSRIYVNDVLVVDDRPRKRRLRYERDKSFDEMLAHDRETACLFVCHHNELMWRVCTKCNRCAASARSWGERLAPKVLALLAKL